MSTHDISLQRRPWVPLLPVSCVVRYHPVMTERDYSRVTIYLDEWARERRLLERLEAIAKKERRSLSFLVAQAVSEYLDRVEAKE